MAEVLIQLRDVTKHYTEGERERVVLQRTDFSIASGETLVLLGRSGSGQSTLLNLVSGIDTPTSGHIFVQGTDIAHVHEQERTLFRRKHIGFVFQFFNLIPTLTVEENVLLPLELNRVQGTHHHATELLREVGLSDRIHSFPDQLSGGEQQRVAIARALVHDPLLVLADEPTGNLDYDTGVQVLALLDRLVRQRGKTMLIATHSRDVVDIADRVVAIRDKRIVVLSTGEQV